MNLILFAIIVVIIIALLVWAVDFLPLQSPFNGIVKFLFILLGVLLIANRAGLV